MMASYQSTSLDIADGPITCGVSRIEMEIEAIEDEEMAKDMIVNEEIAAFGEEGGKTVGDVESYQESATEVGLDCGVKSSDSLSGTGGDSDVGGNAEGKALIDSNAREVVVGGEGDSLVTESETSTTRIGSDTKNEVINGSDEVVSEVIACDESVTKSSYQIANDGCKDILNKSIGENEIENKVNGTRSETLTGDVSVAVCRANVATTADTKSALGTDGNVDKERSSGDKTNAIQGASGVKILSMEIAKTEISYSMSMKEKIFAAQKKLAQKKLTESKPIQNKLVHMNYVSAPVPKSLKIPRTIKPPSEIELKKSQLDPDEIGAWCVSAIKEGRIFGPFKGYSNQRAKLVDFKRAWEIYDKETHVRLFVLNATNPVYGDWMRFVNSSSDPMIQNMASIQRNTEVFYMATRNIEPGEELVTSLGHICEFWQENEGTEIRKIKLVNVNDTTPIDPLADEVILRVPKSSRGAIRKPPKVQWKNPPGAKSTTANVQEKKLKKEEEVNDRSTVADSNSTVDSLTGENVPVKVKDVKETAKEKSAKSTCVNEALTKILVVNVVKSPNLHDKCKGIVTLKKISPKEPEITHLEKDIVKRKTEKEHVKAEVKEEKKVVENRRENGKRLSKMVIPADFVMTDTVIMERPTKNGGPTKKEVLAKLKRTDSYKVGGASRSLPNVLANTTKINIPTTANDVNLKDKMVAGSVVDGCKASERTELSNVPPLSHRPMFAFEITEDHHVIDNVGQRLYKCDVCSSLYNKGFSLKRHFIHNHIFYKYVSVNDITNCCVNVAYQQTNYEAPDDLELLADVTDVPDTVKIQKRFDRVWLPGLYRCDECRTLFDYIDDLISHDHNETAILQKKRSFACDQCPMKFLFQRNLDRHHLIHTGDKTFMCSLCQQGFPTIFSLRKHKKVHMSGRVSCSYCSLTFSLSCHVKKHIRAVHKDHVCRCSICDEEQFGHVALRHHLYNVHDIGTKLEYQRLTENVENPENDDEDIRTGLSGYKRIELDNRSPRRNESELSQPVDEASMKQLLQTDSVFKFMCTVCKMRFRSYSGMCKHRRNKHQLTVHAISKTQPSNKAQVPNKTQTQRRAKNPYIVPEPDSENDQDMWDDGNVGPIVWDPYFYDKVSANIAYNFRYHIHGKTYDIWKYEKEREKELMLEMTSTPQKNLTVKRCEDDGVRVENEVVADDRVEEDVRGLMRDVIIDICSVDGEEIVKELLDELINDIAGVDSDVIVSQLLDDLIKQIVDTRHSFDEDVNTVMEWIIHSVVDEKGSSIDCDIRVESDSSTYHGLLDECQQKRISNESGSVARGIEERNLFRNDLEHTDLWDVSKVSRQNDGGMKTNISTREYEGDEAIPITQVQVQDNWSTEITQGFREYINYNNIHENQFNGKVLSEASVENFVESVKPSDCDYSHGGYKKKDEEMDTIEIESSVERFHMNRGDVLDWECERTLEEIVGKIDLESSSLKKIIKDQSKVDLHADRDVGNVMGNILDKIDQTSDATVFKCSDDGMRMVEVGFSWFRSDLLKEKTRPENCILAECRAAIRDIIIKIETNTSDMYMTASKQEYGVEEGGVNSSPTKCRYRIYRQVKSSKANEQFYNMDFDKLMKFYQPADVLRKVSKTYKCSVCTHVFSRERDYKIHFQVKHACDNGILADVGLVSCDKNEGTDTEFPDDSPTSIYLRDYDSYKFGAHGHIQYICSVCFRLFHRKRKLTIHQKKYHPFILCLHLQIEDGHKIDKLHFKVPTASGLLVTPPNASNYVAQRSEQLFRCSLCDESFSKISLLHSHIQECTSQCAIREAKNKIRQHTVSRTVECPASITRNNSFGAVERKPIINVQSTSTPTKTKFVYKTSEKSPTSEMKSVHTVSNTNTKETLETKASSPITPVKKTIVRSEESKACTYDRGKRKLVDYQELAGTKRKKIDYQELAGTKPKRFNELKYVPEKHVRRRDMSDCIDQHQCRGCGLKFLSLLTLEKHAKNCENKEKLCETKTVTQPKPHVVCHYCRKEFIYAKSVLNHYTEFCPIRKYREDNNLLTDSDLEQEEKLRQLVADAIVSENQESSSVPIKESGSVVLDNLMKKIQEEGLAEQRNETQSNVTDRQTLDTIKVASLKRKNYSGEALEQQIKKVKQSKLQKKQNAVKKKIVKEETYVQSSAENVDKKIDDELPTFSEGQDDLEHESNVQVTDVLDVRKDETKPTRFSPRKRKLPKKFSDDISPSHVSKIPVVSCKKLSDEDILITKRKEFPKRKPAQQKLKQKVKEKSIKKVRKKVLKKRLKKGGVTKNREKVSNLPAVKTVMSVMKKSQILSRKCGKTKGSTIKSGKIARNKDSSNLGRTPNECTVGMQELRVSISSHENPPTLVKNLSRNRKSFTVNSECAPPKLSPIDISEGSMVFIGEGSELAGNVVINDVSVAEFVNDEGFVNFSEENEVIFAKETDEDHVAETVADEVKSVSDLDILLACCDETVAEDSCDATIKDSDTVDNMLLELVHHSTHETVGVDDSYDNLSLLDTVYELSPAFNEPTAKSFSEGIYASCQTEGDASEISSTKTIGASKIQKVHSPIKKSCVGQKVITASKKAVGGKKCSEIDIVEIANLRNENKKSSHKYISLLKGGIGKSESFPHVTTITDVNEKHDLENNCMINLNETKDASAASSEADTEVSR